MACVPRSSCDPELCLEGGANPAQCAVGECRGELCASVSTCGEGTLCCEEGCVDCRVDESDPCMQPTCEGAGCGKEPRLEGTPCNVNGNFCDGFGFCDAVGGCTVTIQACGEECDEVTDRCVGCNEPSDCPPTIVGNNCPAAIGPNDCTATVIPTITPFSCEDNVCTPLPDVPGDAISCNRDNGVVCRDTTFTVWEPCEYSDSCALSGIARRVRTDSACGGGRRDPFQPASCIDSDMNVVNRTRCDRLAGGAGGTNGTACSATPQDTFIDTCGGFMGVCGEMGTQAVTTFVSTCSGGSCDPAGGTIPSTQTCSRDQSGESCGDDVTVGDWSECTRVNATDCTGSRTRTVTTETCLSESCQAVDVLETDSSCSIMDGTSCGDTGTCMSTGGNVCTGTEATPICDSGSCDMANSVACELIGIMCAPDEDGACVPNADECMGDRTPVTHACAAGGVCEATNEMSVTCLLTGTACGDDSACTGGTCNGGACDQAVDCGAMDACMPACMGMGSSCGCNGSNACECM